MVSRFLFGLCDIECAGLGSDNGGVLEKTNVTQLVINCCSALERIWNGLWL
jgi:hypothetical protein